MATNTGHVMNLANSIIGVSVLAMPFCFKQCGITLAILLLIVSSIITRLACHFLVKSSMMVRRTNFEFLAFYAFGSSGKLFVELGVIGFMMGTCVAFFVVMGDLGPPIVSQILDVTNTSTLRSTVLIGVGLCLVLPLGLLRNVQSLAAVSTLTICFYLLLIVKIFAESSTHLVAGDWIDKVNFWRPEGFLQCFPIFAMALSCQTQIFEIFDTIPNASLDKMNAVVRSAVNMCTVVYISVGLLGYVAYSGGNFAGNILLSFSPSVSTDLYKLGFVVSLAVSFPLVIFPCRASLHSLLYKKMSVHQELNSLTSSYIPDSRFKILTLGIVTVSLITGLLIPNIELVLGFVGSTIGVAICVIFPSVAFINLTTKETNERLVAKMTLVAGIIIMVVGTYGNLYAASESKPVAAVPPARPDLNPLIPAVKPVAEVVVNKPEIVPALPDKVSPSSMIADKPNDDPKPAVPIEQAKRQEPPAPVPPVDLPVERPAERPVERPAERPVPDPPVYDKTPPKLEAPLPPKIPAVDTVPKPDMVVLDKALAGELKPLENINKDAIAKEEREEKEDEKQKRIDEEKKKTELLKTLKEHADEQKKLLAEQQKILSEMKNRVPEKPVETHTDKPVQEIDSAKFSENIEKIQDVIEDLKDKKELLEKEKKIEQMMKDEKVEPQVLIKASKIAELPLLPEVKAGVDSRPKNMALPVPLALAKQKESVETKQEALGRDILEQSREKREVLAPEGECDNKKMVDKMVDKMADKETSTESENKIISQTARLSPPQISGLDPVPEAPQASDGKVPDLLIPKKRDLKSVKTDGD